METVRFDELDLYPQVLRAIKEMGFEEATPIQSRAIPAVMSGADVIGQAQTGTGKTASFGIPALHKVDVNSKKTQVIILSPTALIKSTMLSLKRWFVSKQTRRAGWAESRERMSDELLPRQVRGRSSTAITAPFALAYSASANKLCFAHSRRRGRSSSAMGSPLG